MSCGLLLTSKMLYHCTSLSAHLFPLRLTVSDALTMAKSSSLGLAQGWLAWHTWTWESQPGLLLLSGKLDTGGQANLLQERNYCPRGVNLPPLQAMPGAKLKGMVIVVPALSKCQQANPPVTKYASR